MYLPSSHLEPGSKDERSVMWTPIDSHTKGQSLQLPITTHGPVQCNSVPLLARRSFIPCAHTYVCMHVQQHFSLQCPHLLRLVQFDEHEIAYVSPPRSV